MLAPITAARENRLDDLAAFLAKRFGMKMPADIHAVDEFEREAGKTKFRPALMPVSGTGREPESSMRVRGIS